jgi:uncharacterized Zn-finger protein
MNRVSYNYHIRTHNAADRRFVCPECLKPFVTNAKLVQHMRCHTGEKTVKEGGKNIVKKLISHS